MSGKGRSPLSCLSINIKSAPNSTLFILAEGVGLSQQVEMRPATVLEASFCALFWSSNQCSNLSLKEKQPYFSVWLPLFWRKGWDSNPRYRCRHDGFQDRFLRPLGHPSATGVIIASRGDFLKHNYARAKTSASTCVAPARRSDLAADSSVAPVVKTSSMSKI